MPRSTSRSCRARSKERTKKRWKLLNPKKCQFRFIYGSVDNYSFLGHYIVASRIQYQHETNAHPVEFLLALSYASVQETLKWCIWTNRKGNSKKSKLRFREGDKKKIFRMLWSKVLLFGFSIFVNIPSLLHFVRHPAVLTILGVSTLVNLPKPKRVGERHDKRPSICATRTPNIIVRHTLVIFSFSKWRSCWWCCDRQKRRLLTQLFRFFNFYFFISLDFIFMLGLLGCICMRSRLINHQRADTKNSNPKVSLRKVFFVLSDINYVAVCCVYFNIFFSQRQKVFLRISRSSPIHKRILKNCIWKRPRILEAFFFEKLHGDY